MHHLLCRAGSKSDELMSMQMGLITKHELVTAMVIQWLSSFVKSSPLARHHVICHCLSCQDSSTSKTFSECNLYSSMFKYWKWENSWQDLDEMREWRLYPKYSHYDSAYQQGVDLLTCANDFLCSSYLTSNRYFYRLNSSVCLWSS